MLKKIPRPHIWVGTFFSRKTIHQDVGGFLQPLPANLSLVKSPFLSPIKESQPSPIALDLKNMNLPSTVNPNYPYFRFSVEGSVLNCLLFRYLPPWDILILQESLLRTCCIETLLLSLLPYRQHNHTLVVKINSCQIHF